jgi:hypothetical protein
MSVGIGRQNIIILFWKQQFYLWEHINDIYIGFSLALHLQCKVMCWKVAPYRSCIVCTISSGFAITVSFTFSEEFSLLTCFSLIQ